MLKELDWHAALGSAPSTFEVQGHPGLHSGTLHINDVKTAQVGVYYSL